ncbi:MAG TPA: hypothetical protein VGR89_04310 [Puia sp.]|nr:hypothetical protein [Puia sp.]
MERRRFLLLTSTGVLATLTPFCNSRRNDPALSKPIFLSAICDARTLREIGAAYRASTPDEAKRSHLAGSLTEGIPENVNLANQLNAQVRQDFASGKTVTVDGWVLSVTEARQCALFSLV